MNRFRKSGLYPPTPVCDGIDPPDEVTLTTWINVNGREEHESILKDAQRCAELGLDQYYEVRMYLKRWGGWLHEQ